MKAINKLSFYDQAAIIVPGAVVFLSALFLIPDLRALLANDGITIGSLGFILIIAYAAGHSVAPIGRIVANILWRIRGGEPSEWVACNPPKLLNEQQLNNIEERIRKRFNLQITAIKGLPRSEWKPFFKQIYRDVLLRNPGRVETLLAVYALNRGLVGSFLAVGFAIFVACFFFQSFQWQWGLVSLAFSILAGLQMHQCFIRFAEEVLCQFLLLPAEPASSRPPDKKRVRADAKLREPSSDDKTMPGHEASR